MRKTDLAYAAGIVDGEGTISLFRCGKSNHSLSLTVAVSNTNMWLVQWLKFAFGGNAYLARDGQGTNKKDVYTWGIYSLPALEFLKLVYPYLRLKKPQAEIAIKFLEMRKYKRYRLTPEELAFGEILRIEMHNLNQVGRASK